MFRIEVRAVPEARRQRRDALRPAEVCDARRLKALEDENRRRRGCWRRRLDAATLREVLGKNF